MKYIVHGIFYLFIKICYFIWNFNFGEYTFKDYLDDVESYEYPINY